MSDWVVIYLISVLILAGSVVLLFIKNEGVKSKEIHGLSISVLLCF